MHDVSTGKDGQIGNGSTNMFDARPVEVDALKDKGIVSVACGAGHTAALSKTGRLYMWGR